jgi:putative transposase
VLRRPLESAQYTSFAFTSRLIDAGVDASVGSVGDGYDNALAETTIGLYRTEKIHREGPWRTLADVELATLEWVDWYNHERLHSGAGDLPPVEFEDLYLNKTGEAGNSITTASIKPGAVQYPLQRIRGGRHAVDSWSAPPLMSLARCSGDGPGRGR